MLLAGLLLAAAAAGCGRKKSDVGGELPVMPVSHPIARVVTDYADFTGRTDAKFSVNIVARVTGYLVPVEKPVKQASEAKEADPAVNRQEGGYAFKEGSEVKKGDLLFLIDPRPYQAQYDQAQSQVTLDEAQLNLAKTTLARYQALNKDTPGAVSEQALDQYKAAVVEAEARVFAQRKSLEVYKLNKDFTHVVSPIDGQVSRYYLTLGNLVNQDQTLLTTIVSLDPMYVYFDMDESTYLQILKTIKEGKGTPAGDGDVSILLGSQVLLGLQNEDDKFPHTATIDFVNNQVNSTTGSITVRGVFANPPLVPATQASSTAAGKAPSMEKASAADAAKTSGAGAVPAEKASTPVAANKERLAPRQFKPGMFVRVRQPVGAPHPALLVIDRVIQNDQGRKYVFVLDTESKAQRRYITPGYLQPDGLRVVEGEIKPDDWVIVGAIQQVREKMEVKPDPRPMPTLSGQAEVAPQPVGGAKPAPSPSGKAKD